jgi:methyl-accepting chemotaxis protein
MQTSVANLDQLQKVFDHATEAVVAADRGIDDIAGGVREHSNNSNDIARHIEEIAAMSARNTSGHAVQPVHADAGRVVRAIAEIGRALPSLARPYRLSID